MAIEVGIDDAVQGQHAWVVVPLKNLVLIVIPDRLGPEAIDLGVMPDRRSDVDDIDHDRNDRLHATIDRSGHPGRPTPLRRPSHHELLDPPTLLARPFLHAIHGADHALDHRKSRQPGGVAGFQVLVPGVPDQIVLRAFLPVAMKYQRLVGNRLQFDHHAAARCSDL